jgi:hypothetical protein
MSAAPTGPTFHSTFIQFCDDLAGTFPELSVSKSRELNAEESLKFFRVLWKNSVGSIAIRDTTIFSDSGIEIVPGVVITKSLWNEVTENTHNAIWNYLSSLVLLSASVVDEEDESSDAFWNEDDFKKSMEEMMKNMKDAVGGEGGDSPFSAMGGIFEKLKGMAGLFGGIGESDSEGAEGTTGGSGGASMPEFKLPKKLLNGHIARMARDLASEFKPEDFGISPEMLDVEDPAKIFAYLQEIFTKKPDLLMNAAKRIAKKIQSKFQRGEIRREDILREIEELMKDFSENDAFSSLFGQLGEVMKFAGKASGNEGSERRRVVQERLRKKTAEKDARKTNATASVSVGSSAAADAVAAALLAEEENSKRKKSGKK